MSATLSRAELAALKPCRIPEGLFKGGERLDAATAFERGVSVEDMLWAIGAAGHKMVCVKAAIAFARRVQHLTDAPQAAAAIDAAQAWVDNPCKETMAAARAAAWAAWAARDAAGAARAAARAAAEDAARAAAEDAAGAAGNAALAAGAAEVEAQKAIIVELLDGLVPGKDER